MTDQLLQPSDELLEQALARRAPRGPDPDLLRQIAAVAGQTPQARRWWPLGVPWINEPTRRLVWIAVVLMLTVAFAIGAIVAGGLPRSPALVVEPMPEASAAASPKPSLDPDAPVAIEDVAEGEFRPDVTYTSRGFEPWITFRLRRSIPNTGTYLIPSSRTSARTIVIEYRGRRGEEIRVTRPFAVDCGTPDEHPDAATLAAAILAKPGLANVRDLGTDPYRSESATSSNLIYGTYPKQVLKIDGTGRTFDARVSDPDQCRLLAEPGSGDPTIEIRGDMAALLILTDVGGELVVIRVSDRGYDAPTGAAFMTRDYLVDPTALTASPLPVYLGDLLDLETVYGLQAEVPAPSDDPAAPGASPSPEPTPASIELRPSPWPVLPIEGAASINSPERTYTSDRFLPRITWEVRGPAASSEHWCPSPHTSARTIVRKHLKGCVQDLRIIRPFSVDCGTAGAHPNADALAQVVFDKLGNAAAEETGASPATDTVPPDLFAGTDHRRVIRILGSDRSFDRTATDPDACRLMPEPGSGDDVVEIRGDVRSTLVLIDVDGELIVLRASLGGHDLISGTEAAIRGYAAGDADSLRHLLSANQHIRFE